MAEPVVTYVADDAYELPSLTGLLPRTGRAAPVPPGATVSEGEVARHRLDATYFDTPDLRLAADGVTLRRRTGGDDAGWQLTVHTGSGARAEVRLPPGRVPPGRTPRAVPERLQAMVWARTDGVPLEAVARVVTERTVRRLTDATGRVLVELTDDRVTARRLLHGDGTGGEAAGAPRSWREIGLTLGDPGGDLGDFGGAVDAGLRAVGRLEPAPGSPLALVVDGDGPRARPAGPPRLTPRSRAGDVLLAHLRQQVEQVRTQDLPVRLDAPDSVHKMRVATRRLRSALTTFQPLLDPAIARPLRAELKWLAAELGAARDAEVMRDRIRGAVGEEHPGEGAEAVEAELTAAYRAAHDRVLAELDGERYHRLLTALRALVERPPLRPKAKAPARKALPPLVARSFTRVERLVQRAGELPEGAERDELLHDARKQAKQARYAGEAVASVFGKDATAFAAALEDVQEALGEHQDSIVTRERLHRLAVQASSTEVAFLYGRLHALEEARGGASQRQFDAAWRAAGRKRLHRWLAA